MPSHYRSKRIAVEGFFHYGSSGFRVGLFVVLGFRAEGVEWGCLFVGVLQPLGLNRNPLTPHSLSLATFMWVVVKIMVPFLGTLDIRSQKGTIILTTTHVASPEV